MKKNVIRASVVILMVAIVAATVTVIFNKKSTLR